MTIKEALIIASERLRNAGIIESGREAASLMEAATGKNRAFQIAHAFDELDINVGNDFEALVDRRSRREPFHYVVGKKEFYGLAFKVNPAVLIPRPETEQLVTLTIDTLNESDQKNFILDVGTGSGCIPIAILKNTQNVTAVACDISCEALKVAEENAQIHGVENRLKFLESDLLASVADLKFDLITANLPYVPVDEISTLQPEVRDFEPGSALTDYGDGLGLIRRLIISASDRLRSGGTIYLEIGAGQAETILEMFERTIWKDVEVYPDFQQIPRVIKAALRE